MRKRIHGKQSVPANILFSLERAKTLLSLIRAATAFSNAPASRTLAIFVMANFPRLMRLILNWAYRDPQEQSPHPHPWSPNKNLRRALCYRRTLYTSNALDESNIIVSRKKIGVRRNQRLRRPPV